MNPDQDNSDNLAQPTPASEPIQPPVPQNANQVQQPIAPPQPQGFDDPTSVKKSEARKFSAVFVGIAAVVILLFGSAAAYFGYFVPNKPENIWKSALSNSAKGFDALVDDAKEQQDVKGATVVGSFSLSGQGLSGDANINGEFYEKQGQGSIDVGFSGARYNAEIRAIEAENADYPDLYVKVDGIKGLGSLLGAGLGSNDLGTLVDELDGQWVFIDHTAVDQAVKQLESASAQDETPEISNEDVIKMAEKIADVNERYLFSSDESTAVLNVTEELGKEDYEGRSSYKFRVGVNKDNLKKYITALKEELKDTKLFELLGEDYDKTFDSAIDDIDSGDIDESNAEVWVDMSTKLIRNVRFVEDDNQNNVFDISLLYEGGDAYPFRFKFHDDEAKMDAEFTLTINSTTDEVEFAVDVSSEEGDVDVKGSIKVTPKNDAVDVQKPSDAKSITEIVGSFYGAINQDPGITGTNGEPGSSSQIGATQLGGSLLRGFEL